MSRDWHAACTRQGQFSQKNFLLMIKKLLLIISLAALFCSCSKQREWNREQRQQMRQDLRTYRDMVYLTDLNDVEWELFADDVAVALENDYPVYATFIEMPSVEDTVTMVVVETVVTQLDADAHNMRHLFPYRQLVAEGILPDGMSHQQIKSYYTCLAKKVDNYYNSMEQFFGTILMGNLDTTRIGTFQRQCAADFESVVVTEIDVIETN